MKPVPEPVSKKYGGNSPLRRWTISDVARQAAVSKTTVSRVLNERPEVDAQTLARVQAVVREVGFVKNARAVQLAKGRSNAIGMLLPFDFNPWFLEVIRGAMAEIHASNFSLTMHAFPETELAMAKFGAQLRSGLVDALLVVSLDRRLEPVYQAARSGVPVMFLQDFGFNVDAPTIGPDDTTGVEELVDHLVGVGRSRFALIAGPPEFHVSAVRLAAYRSSLAGRGFGLDERLVVTSSYSETGGLAATRILIERGLPFDALFASSDAIAVGAIRALKERGYSVPRDVSVVGFDDFEAAALCEPSLTTVRYPLREMSALAVRRLIEAGRGSGRLSSGSEIVKTHLVVRDSSDPKKG
jgi:LacI family transcriptional regulator